MMKFLICAIFLTLVQFSALSNCSQVNNPPYIDLVLCPMKEKPWDCAGEQTSRLLDGFNEYIKFEWQNLKAEADKEFNSTVLSRSLETSKYAKEKPSTILRKIEIGTNFMENFTKEAAEDIFEGQIDEENDQNSGDINDHRTSNIIRRRKKQPVGALAAATLSNLMSGDNFNMAEVLDAGLKKKLHSGFIPFKSSSRSLDIEEPRGKKKKKKALMKLMFIATVIKGKIELLLKILSAHLQVKFFVIALIGLIVNIARFWIDVRRGGVLQKVIYYENAHHQHTYEEHPPEEWDQPASGGGYWKRSLPANSKGQQSTPTGYSTDLTYSSSQYDPNYMAYRRNMPINHQ